MKVIVEIRRLHFVEHATVSHLAKRFKLSRPTIGKHFLSQAGRLPRSVASLVRTGCSLAEQTPAHGTAVV
jgi:hypothetical protein